MENDSLTFSYPVTTSFTMSTNESADQGGTESTPSPTIELPLGIEAFAPLLFIELLIMVPCNLALMALVIKARKVNNNTNIYLFSLAISGLLKSVILFNLMVVVFTRRWIFGREMCYINDFLFRLAIFPILLIHALVSRDRYNAIRDPLNHWKVSTKKTYVLSFTVWVVSGVLALGSVLWYVLRTPLSNDPLNGLECFFGLDMLQGDYSVSLFEVVASMFIIPWVISLSIFTLWHYFLVLRQLHTLTKLRSQFRVLSNSTILKVNGQDKPLHCTAEERAAKSLALTFLLEFICSVTSLSIIAILSALLILRYTSMKNTFSAIIVLALSILILPGINPVILALSNKRFRNRVKGLLKCELRPELEESHDYGHLEETDEIRLPSVAAPTISKRHSIHFIHKIENGGSRRPEQDSVQGSVDNQEEEETMSKAHSKRTGSIATVHGVRIELNGAKENQPSPKHNVVVDAWKEIGEQ